MSLRYNDIVSQFMVVPSGIELYKEQCGIKIKKPQNRRHFGGNQNTEFCFTDQLLRLVIVVPVISGMGVVIDLFESCCSKVRINLGSRQ